MVPVSASPIATQIKAAKLVSRFTQEARFGQRLEPSDYAKIARSHGFSGRESLSIARRAFAASEAQNGKCPQMSWRRDAAWTKF